jgi:hypothetical protein
LTFIWTYIFFGAKTVGKTPYFLNIYIRNPLFSINVRKTTKLQNLCVFSIFFLLHVHSYYINIFFLFSCFVPMGWSNRDQKEHCCVTEIGHPWHMPLGHRQRLGCKVIVCVRAVEKWVCTQAQRPDAKWLRCLRECKHGPNLCRECVCADAARSIRASA